MRMRGSKHVAAGRAMRHGGVLTGRATAWQGSEAHMQCEAMLRRCPPAQGCTPRVAPGGGGGSGGSSCAERLAPAAAAA